MPPFKFPVSRESAPTEMQQKGILICCIIFAANSLFKVYYENQSWLARPLQQQLIAWIGLV